MHEMLRLIVFVCFSKLLLTLTRKIHKEGGKLGVKYYI